MDVEVQVALRAPLAVEHFALGHRLDHVVVEALPLAADAHIGDVVPGARARADVPHDRRQLVASAAAAAAAARRRCDR